MLGKKSLVQNIYGGKYKVLYLLSADEIDFDKIPKDTFVIYQGHHGDKAVKRADLIIPMSCFTEKEGLYVNLEGRPQISSQIKFPLEGVDSALSFYNKVLLHLGRNIICKDQEELRVKMFSEVQHLEKINQIEKTNFSKPLKRSFKLSNAQITSNIENFYMTDSVSRNSLTMSKCSVAFNSMKNDEN